MQSICPLSSTIDDDRNDRNDRNDCSGIAL